LCRMSTSLLLDDLLAALHHFPWIQSASLLCFSISIFHDPSIAELSYDLFYQATEHTRLRYDVIIISFWLENSAESGTFHTKNIAHCFVHVRSIPQRYISYDLFAFLILGRTYYCQVTLLHLKSWDAWIVASGWFSDWHLVLSLTLHPVSDLCDLEQHLCGNPVLCFVPARIAQMFLDCSLTLLSTGTGRR
jgi:hypothetical protein